MRIVHIARDIRSTGGGEVVKQIARHMSAGGIDVVVVTDTPGLDLGAGVTVIVTPFGARLIDWKPRVRLGWHVRHALQILAFSVFSSIAASRLCKGSVVFNHNCESLVGDVLVMHNVFSAELERRQLSRLGIVRAFLNPVRAMRISKERFLSMRVWGRHFVAVSPAARADVEALAGGVERVSVVSNGVDISAFGQATLVSGPPVFTEWHHGDFEVLVLFIGHEYRRKGLDDLLEAISILPNRFGLVVVGGASQDGRRYDAMLERLEITNRVLFAGEHSDVRPFLREATVFCLPSYYETMPLVALEALAAGVPIVLTAECPAAALIRPGVTGRMTSHDPSDISRALIAVSEDMAHTKNIEAIKESVVNLGWESVAAEYVEVAVSVSRAKLARATGARQEPPIQ